MVLFPDTLDGDLALSDLLSHRNLSVHADVVRLWANHFSYLKDAEVVIVPSCWSEFCSLNLMRPKRFGWVKSLMESKAWSLITKDTANETSYTFTIPKSCPSNEPIQCINNTSDEIQSQSLAITSTTGNISTTPSLESTKLKRKSKAPFSVIEVRRSERIKIGNNGFKEKSFSDKPYL
jgi:hypothetical protein